MQSDLLQNIKNEALRIEEDTIFSSKGHFNMASYWGRAHYIVGIPMVAAAALSASKLLEGNDWGACLALLAAGLAAIQTLVNPEKKASTHQVCGGKYLALRNNTRNFRELELLQIQDNRQALQKIKALSDERNALNQTSPSIPRCAYKEAKKDIEEDQAALHQVDVNTQKEKA